MFAHDNIRERKDEIDRLGWEIFLTSFSGGRWIDFTFDVSRALYQIFLSEHFDRRLEDVSDGVQRDLDQNLLAMNFKLQ